MDIAATHMATLHRMRRRIALIDVRGLEQQLTVLHGGTHILVDKCHDFYHREQKKDRPRCRYELGQQCAAISLQLAASRWIRDNSPANKSISESSDFELILQGEKLDRAKARFGELYRAELEARHPHDNNRSRAGPCVFFQRDIAQSTWQRLQEQAQHYLSDERLAHWGNWTTAHATGHRRAGERRD